MLLIILICVFGCVNNASNNKPSTIVIQKDVTKPLLKSGYYLIVDSTVSPSLKKTVYNLQKGDYMDGEECYLSMKSAVFFNRIEKIYVTDDDRPSLFIQFDKVGATQLGYLTAKKVYTDKTENDLTRLGMVIDNTLVQVCVVMNQITNGAITLNGPYSSSDLEKIREIILNLSEQVSN